MRDFHIHQLSYWIWLEDLCHAHWDFLRPKMMTQEESSLHVSQTPNWFNQIYQMLAKIFF